MKILSWVGIVFFIINSGCSEKPGELEVNAKMGQENPSSSETASENLVKILQLTIDLEILEPYFHSQLPERKPLLILKNESLKSEPPLRKFGEPVQFVSPSGALGRPYLEFTKIDIQGTTALVQFAYPVEGLLGNVILRRTDSSWKVEERELSEKKTGHS